MSALSIDVGNYDFAAFTCDQLAASLSESATGAGHQANLSVQVSHGYTSSKCRLAPSLVAPAFQIRVGGRCSGNTLEDDR
jgi:hypothetical protein